MATEKKHVIMLRPTQHPPRRIPTRAGYAKVNVGAVVRKHHNFGAVAEVCSAENETYLGSSSVMILEALACREALMRGRDLSLERFQVASDCLEVINGMGTNKLGRSTSSVR
jgi:hypothetical protein